MSRAPNQPSYTCPDIDKIISMLEELRKDNAALREYGEWWEEHDEETERNKDIEIEDLHRQISELEQKLAEFNS
jgi:hypothetical protein